MEDAQNHEDKVRVYAYCFPPTLMHVRVVRPVVPQIFTTLSARGSCRAVLTSRFGGKSAHLR